jgi:hypothetical protein
VPRPAFLAAGALDPPDRFTSTTFQFSGFKISGFVAHRRRAFNRASRPLEASRGTGVAEPAGN